jgi:hypothetical protein
LSPALIAVLLPLDTDTATHALVDPEMANKSPPPVASILSHDLADLGKVLGALDRLDERAPAELLKTALERFALLLELGAYAGIGLRALLWRKGLLPSLELGTLPPTECDERLAGLLELGRVAGGCVTRGHVGEWGLA